MSYRCATRGLAAFGLPDGPAAISCDGPGCDERIEIIGTPPKWFLDGKAERGWSRVVHGDGTSTDCCPACKGKR
jgi:hypothetical protein